MKEERKKYYLPLYQLDNNLRKQYHLTTDNNEKLRLKSKIYALEKDIETYRVLCNQYLHVPEKNKNSYLILINDFENVLNEKYNLNIKKTTKNNETLNKGEKYTVKEKIHNVNQKAGKAAGYVGKGALLLITAVLALLSISGGIGALSVLFTESNIIAKVLGTGVYGAIAYFTGKGAITTFTTYEATNYDVKTAKEQIKLRKEKEAEAKKKREEFKKSLKIK